jgi:hypothetical protein
MAKKQRMDLGKGFKRIFYVIAGLWIAFVCMLFFGDFMACKVHKMDSLSQCWDYNLGSQFLFLILMVGLVLPLYYFLKWIGAGFKK